MPDGEPAGLSEYAKKVLREKGIEIPELKKPVTVPPVEPPEYFPGFGKELAQLGVEQYKAAEQIAKAEERLAGIQRKAAVSPLLQAVGLKPLFKVNEWGMPISDEEYEQRLQLAKQEYSLAMQNLKSTEWRQEVLVTMPNYLSIPDYKIQWAGDILQYVPLDDMRDEDVAWLTSVFDRLKHLSNVLPEGFDGDAIEAQTMVLNEILTAPKLELRAVHNLTVEEIAKSFAFGVAELPQGMTEEQVRGMLSRMDLQDEEMKSARDWLSERAKNWAIESNRLNLIRAGTLLAEAPSLTPLEFGKLLVTQPMMATVELLEKYFNILARPLSAAILMGVQKIPGAYKDPAATRLEENYDFYRSMGESSWSAYAKAFNAWEAPWWKKMAIEVVFDPVSYIGLGMATALSYKLGTGLTKVGLRPLGTRIGPWVGAVENGYIAGADAIFKAGIKAVLSPIKGAFWLTGAGYQIPRTFTMMSRNFARESYMKLSSALQRTYPEVRNMKGLTAKDAVDTATNAIDQAIARPMEGWDIAVKAGAPLLEFNYIDDLAARRLTKEVAEELTFDTNRLAHLNNEVLNMFSGQGERITAGKMIADLGQEATEEMVEKLSAKLVAFKQSVADKAKSALKGDTATDVLMNTFNRLEGIRYANLQSPLTKYMNQAGRSASWHSRVSDRVLYSSALVALERRLVMPIARWNLLFANFGPYNFAENMQRSFLGGAEVLYPRSYSVGHTDEVLGGLAGDSYEFVMYARGEARRMTQALVDPKTGKTEVFKGGKIPFITKDVVVPQWVPKWMGRGKLIGGRINLYGVDYPLGSFTDQYDMFADMTMKQTRYDQHVHFFKAMADIAPDEVRKIRGVFDKHRHMLNDIGAISKPDANDIDKTLFELAFRGPEHVRIHANIDVLTFERRQISKEYWRTADKCTDVRMVTKRGIQDDILDGSMFPDIDGKMVARVEQERELSLISLKNQINVLKDEADNFIANPPRNLDEFLGDMQNISSMVEGTGERIHDYRKLTELRKAKLLPGEMDDFEVGSAKLLAEFMETAEADLTRIMNQLVKNAEATGLPNRAAVRSFWNEHLEKNALRTGVLDTDAGAFLAHEIEAGGDIIREFGKEIPDPAYLAEKFNRLRRDIRSRDWTDALSGGELSRLESVKSDLASLPTVDDATSIAKEALDAMVDRNTVRLGTALDRLEPFIRSPEPKLLEPLLNEAQLARLTDLDSVSRLELENILATRNKIAEIEAIIPRTPKGKRNDRFWAQQRAQKSTIWDEFDNNARKFKSLRLRASRNFLNSVDKTVFTPDYIPEVVTELTPNHLAYLYGVTGDDLYRGLTRVQHHVTIRPREDFILHTTEQADAYAAKLGKSAADIGFTDDAIGEVYDQLWRNLGVEPTILTPDSPTVMQLEEIRQEVTRLYAANKLPGKTGPYGAGELVELPSVETTPMILRYSHTVQDLQNIVSGKGTIKIYHGAPQEFAEKLVSEGPRVPYKVQDVVDEVAKTYGLDVRELSALAHRRREVVKSISAAPAPIASRWAQHFPQGEVLTDINNTARLLLRAKGTRRAGEKMSDAYERVLNEGAEAVKASGTGVPATYTAMARALNLPDKYKLKSAKGALVEIEVDASALTEKFSHDAKAYLDDIATGRGTEREILESWNYSYRDYRIDPKDIRSARVVVRDIPQALEERVPDVTKWRKYINSVADDVEKLPAYSTAKEQWWTTKESAITKAREQHALAYPTYDDANIIDESMRAIFPFWNYEMFRWRWIPRTIMRTPGTATGIARYMEYTDQGYLPVPNTDLQINILRGSVWMGGLRSFYLRDFPEYYDVMPGMEFIDYIARAGFFPGIHVMLPIVMWGAATGKPELGQLAPAWVRTGLSALRALSPEHIGKVLEHIYPDRFRDFMGMMRLGGEGYDADLIWRKKQTGEKLTPEEEKIWLKAIANVDGFKGMLMQQTGLFRVRDKQYSEIRKELRLAIEEATGVSVAVQDQIDRRYPVTGKRFSDYYKLDVYQQKLLYEWETYRRWQGVITPLYPSSWQLLDVKTRDYYEELDKVYNEARTVGVYEDDKLIRPSMVEMNRQFVEGEIGPDQWMSFRSDLVGSMAEAVRVLGESPAYKDVPKTFEERCKMLEERNIPTPTQTPDQELLYYYYELRPEYKWNWESQRMERDFDTYYAYIDILLETLDAPHRERLLQRIQADWTPMEKLYWQVSREYMRPYRNLREIVLREYEPEQIQQIRRFEVAAAAEREQLQEIIGPDGLKLISGYQKRLREARQRFRILDPETDAWLNFFGTTTSLLTEEAKQTYEELRKKYLVKDMVK